MMSESLTCTGTSSPKPKRRRRSSLRMPNENPAEVCDSDSVKANSDERTAGYSIINMTNVEFSCIVDSTCAENSTPQPPQTNSTSAVLPDNTNPRKPVNESSLKNVINVPTLTFKVGPQPKSASNGCANTKETHIESDLSLTVLLEDDNSNSTSSVVTAPSFDTTLGKSSTNSLTNGTHPASNDAGNNPTSNDNNLSSNDNNLSSHDIQLAEPRTPTNSYQMPSRTDSVRERIAALCNDQMNFNLKKKKVNIFTEHTGPRWYEADGCTISNGILPQKLIEAFSFLPTYGKPSNQNDLTKFLDKRVQEFVGSGLTNEEFLKLQKLCSDNLLKTGKEPTFKMSFCNVNKSFINEFMPPSQVSETPHGYKLKIIKKHKIRAENDPANTYTKKLKYRGIRIIPMAQPGNEASTSTESDLQPGQDLIFTIRLYRPFSYNSRAYKSRGCYRHSVFSQNIVLLGRQKLTALRDRIVCPNDVDMRIDVSERIEDTALTCAKELFPSGFLFINNVFYVDTRPGCHDTSRRLRQWAAGRGLGPFPVREMGAICLGDLTVRLGHPDVYMHQGNCEHLFTFSDIRLLSPYDPLSSSLYPTHTAVSQYATIYCYSCAEFPSKWTTTNTERVPFDPAFFCDTCLKLYLYKNGKKIGDFKAYSYRGNEINLSKPQG